MSMQDSWDPWSYRDELQVGGRSAELVGFSVEATDGSIGKIDEATENVGGQSVVVDTGPWIFGRKVLLPAGTVDRVDWQEQCVYVNCTKDQVKDSPELGERAHSDDDYREELGNYYRSLYPM